MTARTLSPLVTTEIAKPITAPGFLIEILWPTPFRASSRGDINWNGSVFIRFGFDVRGLGGDGSAMNGSIAFDDIDLTMATLIFTNGIADVPINVWKIYGETQGRFDPVPLFTGVGDDASSDATLKRTTISLVEARTATLFAPREYMSRETGFNVLPPRGTVIHWNGEQFVLENDDG